MATSVLVISACLVLFVGFTVRKTAASPIKRTKDRGSPHSLTGQVEIEIDKDAEVREGGACANKPPEVKQQQREQGSSAARLGRSCAEEGRVEEALDHLTVGGPHSCLPSVGRI